MKPLQTLIIALLIAAMAAGVLTSGAAAESASPTPTSVVAALHDLLTSDPADGPVIGSVAGLSAMLSEGASEIRQESHPMQEAPFIAALHPVLSAR